MLIGGVDWKDGSDETLMYARKTVYVGGALYAGCLRAYKEDVDWNSWTLPYGEMSIGWYGTCSHSISHSITKVVRNLIKIKLNRQLLKSRVRRSWWSWGCCLRGVMEGVGG
jgi:hypothetical protein